ncbi:MAG: hypothetical protein A3G96_06525 [Gammaproteobacteria bacterium RIFCSPLOWO2_12_FULL_52_10]|nr:MAG: hypothetical protein A3G96_06525 [Gammaproteobacteria bacterium RIFCSPLOWO2_12_FULL_52_10]
MQQLYSEQLSRCGAREYFQGVVKSAVINQGFPASDESIVYLVNLLMTFLRSDILFERTPDGLMIKPLAIIYSEAVASNSESNRTQSLRRLGDVALFISGLYAGSLGRSLVDVDYYIAMGGNAYGYLAVCRRYLWGSGGIRIVFNELSEKFAGYVEILAEVGETSNLSGNADILRLYELWQHSGSERLAKKLQALGIHPIKIRRQTH